VLLCWEFVIKLEASAFDEDKYQQHFLSRRDKRRKKEIEA
jgi:hypothetical protein